MNRRALPMLLTLAAAACGERRPAPAADSTAAAAATSTAPALRIVATIGDTASTIEGLAEYRGALYTADWKDGGLYRIDSVGSATRVGQLPTKPGTAILGVAADSAGNIYAAVPEEGVVYRVDAARLGASDFDPAKDAKPFVTGAKGANGLTVEADGHLWISGGDQNAVYHAPPTGGAAVVFAKGYASVSTDTTMPVRAYVTNGLGIDSKGAIYTANTGTGEITRLERKDGRQAGIISVLAKDSRLLGADGIVVTEGDTLYVTANFSNTIAKIDPAGNVTVLATDDAHETLRFPAELKKLGSTVYVTNLNFPVGKNAGQTHKGATVAALQLP
ncbi:MAG TPA: SMP-30/gluconolactonase/LRE family protein [Gemmatimonadales bacterium]|nr:SMP-30/gluconolactonase/LRE family protein [Gemmatimonadales bacterium]